MHHITYCHDVSQKKRLLRYPLEINDLNYGNKLPWEKDNNSRNAVILVKPFRNDGSVVKITTDAFLGTKESNCWWYDK